MSDLGVKAIAAAIAVLVGIGAGIGIGIATGKAVEGKEDRLKQVVKLQQLYL